MLILFGYEHHLTIVCSRLSSLPLTPNTRTKGRRRRKWRRRRIKTMRLVWQEAHSEALSQDPLADPAPGWQDPERLGTVLTGRPPGAALHIRAPRAGGELSVFSTTPTENREITAVVVEWTLSEGCKYIQKKEREIGSVGKMKRIGRIILSITGNRHEACLRSV